MNEIYFFSLIVLGELVIFGLVFGSSLLSTIRFNHKVSLEWAADLKAFQLESLKLHIDNQKLLKSIERNTRELQIQNSMVLERVEGKRRGKS